MLALDRVTLQRRRVSRVGRKAGNRLVGHSGGDRGRRRAGGAFEDVIGFGQLRGADNYFVPVDAQINRDA